MDALLQKRLIIRLLEVIVAIFCVNWVAMMLHWYYSIWWFDMPMHFAGGVFLGLLFLYLSLRFGYIHKHNFIFYGLLFVGIIGIGWELFEFSLDTFITFNPQHLFDSTSDLSFDLAGGLVTLLYYQNKITLI